MIGPQPLREHLAQDVVGRVVHHRELFEDDRLLLGEIRLVESRVHQDVGEDLGGPVHVGVENAQMEGRVFLRGEGVHVAAHGVHVHGDLLGAPRSRALEDQVLDEVGETALAVVLVTGTAADEDADRDRMDLGQGLDEERQSILEDVSGYAHNRTA